MLLCNSSQKKKETVDTIEITQVIISTFSHIIIIIIIILIHCDQCAFYKAAAALWVVLLYTCRPSLSQACKSESSKSQWSGSAQRARSQRGPDPASQLLNVLFSASQRGEAYSTPWNRCVINLPFVMWAGATWSYFFPSLSAETRAQKAGVGVTVCAPVRSHAFPLCCQQCGESAREH